MQIVVVHAGDDPGVAGLVGSQGGTEGVTAPDIESSVIVEEDTGGAVACAIAGTECPVDDGIAINRQALEAADIVARTQGVAHREAGKGAVVPDDEDALVCVVAGEGQRGSGDEVGRDDGVGIGHGEGVGVGAAGEGAVVGAVAVEEIAWGLRIGKVKGDCIAATCIEHVAVLDAAGVDGDVADAEGVGGVAGIGHSDANTAGDATGLSALGSTVGLGVVAVVEVARAATAGISHLQ